MGLAVPYASTNRSLNSPTRALGNPTLGLAVRPFFFCTAKMPAFFFFFFVAGGLCPNHTLVLGGLTPSVLFGELRLFTPLLIILPSPMKQEVMGPVLFVSVI